MHPTPLPTGLPIHVAQCFPKTECTIANGQGGAMLQPATLEVEQEFFPRLLALAVAIPEADKLFVTTEIGAHNHQDTMPRFLQAGPEIDIPFAREAAALPLRQFLLPELFQPADRCRGEARSLWSQERL